MPKRAPIAVGNFAKLVNPDNHYLFVDRTPFIKQIVFDAEVIAFHTFRRGGKSLLASMLQHFFAAEVADVPTKRMFDTLAVGKEDKAFVERYQGQYPVIMLSFKEVQEETVQNALDKITDVIRVAYRQHEYLLTSDKLNANDKDIFNRYYRITETPTKVQLESALFQLTQLLHKHHGKKVWVIIDEYDTPLTAAYRKDYLDSMTLFMKNFLSAGLKDNDYLEKGVLTGILRVSKESMLSGLNNLAVYSVLKPGRYSPYFGFTDAEVLALFKEAELTHEVDIVRQWYNGYQIGGQPLYNPWSIMKYISQGGGEPEAFWVNSANDALLQDILVNASADIKAQLQRLIVGTDTVIGELSEIIRFGELHTDERSLWSLLAAAGYLTVEELKIKGVGYEAHLRIPNEEVKGVYVDVFSKWLEHAIGGRMRYQELVQSLAQGNVDNFTHLLGEFLVTYASSYDLKQENSYHMLTLGLVASLTFDYFIHSNIEAGMGRPDILLIPREATKSPAIILEFKYTKSAEQQEKMADEALAQIDEKHYTAILAKHPEVKTVLKVGMAFCDKSVMTRFAATDLGVRVEVTAAPLEKHAREEESIEEAGSSAGKKKVRKEGGASVASALAPHPPASPPSLHPGSSTR